jgi:hypothetical protein
MSQENRFGGMCSKSSNIGAVFDGLIPHFQGRVFGENRRKDFGCKFVRQEAQVPAGALVGWREEGGKELEEGGWVSWVFS